ncbi:DsrE/DsrF/DrsH-like family protein [Neomoorella glycerini]|uniref:DsrE/DsrF/DrsH-like family protein n=1 Tax=Neomoorella glycerini TaxID=55779 RepID=A0A6I5ZSQ7_9FIRM|nr:DsrE/DsrF/DrsH-like family protein [Moorella glycerini]QGP92411.1 DsrE/DsrF/DrsH-like family protein [Moorella glycerini]
MEQPKLSVILLSGELEKLQAGCLVSSVASMSGMEVNVFVTMEALKAFRKDVINAREFKTASEVGREMLNKNVDLFYQLLENAKDMGNLKLYGCAMAMDLMEWKKEDLIDIFDDVIGVTAFLGKAAGSQVIVM